MGRHSQVGSALYLEDLLSHLSGQLCHFTQARMEMADLYEKMYSLGSQKSINSEELLTTLEAVLHKYSTKSVTFVYNWLNQFLFMFQVPVLECDYLTTTQQKKQKT